MKRLLAILVVMIGSSCADDTQYQNIPSELFTEPVVNVRSGTVKRSINSAPNIVASELLFKGVFEFADSILVGSDYNEVVKSLHQNSCDNKISNQSAGGLEVFLSESVVIHDAVHLRWGSLYYPVFIINPTRSKKTLYPIIDSEIRGIQEAMDSTDKWRPINFCSIDICSDTHDFRSAEINPYHYTLALTPKYDGSFQTKIRLRVQIGENIYVSNEIDGSVDYSQFYFDKKSFEHYLMTDFPGQSTASLFLGSTPLEADVFGNRDSNLWSQLDEARP